MSSRIVAHCYLCNCCAELLQVDLDLYCDPDPDPEAQADRCFAVIAQALDEVGASLDHVVRTRIYITDPSIAESVGRAHARAVGHVYPAATMVVVAALLDHRWLVEIEAEALWR